MENGMENGEAKQAINEAEANSLYSMGAKNYNVYSVGGCYISIQRKGGANDGSYMTYEVRTYDWELSDADLDWLREQLVHRRKKQRNVYFRAKRAAKLTSEERAKMSQM